jgi:hypothetical protein
MDSSLPEDLIVLVTLTGDENQVAPVGPSESDTNRFAPIGFNAITAVGSKA